MKERATFSGFGVPPMATEQPIILIGAMLSPNAMAQPTMMMARLAVLATECLCAQRWWNRLTLEAARSSTRGGGWAPIELGSLPESAEPPRARQARPGEAQEPSSDAAKRGVGVWPCRDASRPRSS